MGGLESLIRETLRNGKVFDFFYEIVSDKMLLDLFELLCEDFKRKHRAALVIDFAEKIHSRSVNSIFLGNDEVLEHEELNF